MNVIDTFRLHNKVILITGGAGLLGREYVFAILEAGGIPIILDIDKDKLCQIEIEIERQFPNMQYLSMELDITKKDGIEKVLESVVNKFGRVDVLINNAAHNPTMEKTNNGNGRFENFSCEEWNKDINVGLGGAFFCCQVIGSYMASQNNGVIINISSDLGIVAPDQRLYHKPKLQEDEQPKKPVTYSVCKWGIIGLTKYLSTYWADQNVRVNAVALGGVYNGQSDEFVQRLIKRIPLGRMADKDEYKSTIVYLCSDASKYMTGTVLIIDGGRTTW